MSTNLFYDEERRVYINLDNGDELPAAFRSNENHEFTYADSYPPKESALDWSEPSGLYSKQFSKQECKEIDPNISGNQLESDHQLALRLAAMESEPRSATRSKSKSKRKQESTRSSDNELGYNNQLSAETRNLNLNDDSALENPPPGWGFEDWTLARALQSMEIEIANEIADGEAFEDVERKASSWRNQLFTASAFICLVQVAVMIAMWIDGGVASQSVNPMIGPSPAVLVRWGAKEMSLMVYEGEWWRLVSPIGLHAGLWHILCNVFIQLRIGGYLNLLWGTPVRYSISLEFLILFLTIDYILLM